MSDVFNSNRSDKDDHFMGENEDLLSLNDNAHNNRPSSVKSSSSSSAPPPPTNPHSYSNNNDNSNSSDFNSDGSNNPRPQKPAGLCWCFEIASFQPYFAVDTPEIMERIKTSLQIWKVSDDGSQEEGATDYFLSTILTKSNGPDAYGPFWISMTLVFLVAVTSNISMFFNSSADDFQADISLLVGSLWAINSFSLGVPIVTHFAIRCLAPEAKGVSFMELFSLYGYSLTAFLPASLVCLIPSQLVHWVALFVASLFSAGLIIRNLQGVYLSSTADENGANQYTTKNTGVLMLGWMLVCQAIFFLVMKLAFFSHNEN